MTRFSDLYQELRESRGFDHAIWTLNPKLASRAWAGSLGVRVPLLLHPPCPLSGLSLIRRVPARFVIKPNHGGNSAGVVPLERIGGRYRSLLGDGLRTWEGWIEWLHRVEQKKPRTHPHPDNVAGPWLLEELILREKKRLPFDWKCYVVGGRVQFILQKRVSPRRRGRARWRAWDRDWSPVSMPKPILKVDPSLPGPRHGPEIVETAELLASHLPTPFVRLDFYEDDLGPIFGEITPEPGGPMRLTSTWDHRLGEAWPA